MASQTEAQEWATYTATQVLNVAIGIRDIMNAIMDVQPALDNFIDNQLPPTRSDNSQPNIQFIKFLDAIEDRLDLASVFKSILNKANTMWSGQYQTGPGARGTKDGWRNMAVKYGIQYPHSFCVLVDEVLGLSEFEEKKLTDTNADSGVD